MSNARALFGRPSFLRPPPGLQPSPILFAKNNSPLNMPDLFSVALRQAPPQRVLFQPESTSRQTRSSGQHNSPTPGSYSQPNGSFSGGGNTMSIISNYEPKPVVPSNVKPVMTPSNNPEHFRTVRSRIANRTARPVPQNKGMMLPGSKLSHTCYFGFHAN